MNLPARLPLLALLGFPLLLAPALHAQTIYLNETFETDTLGSAPTDPSQYRTALTTIVAGNATIGTGGQVASFSDSSASLGGILEYNAGASALGSLFISFDLLNNNPGSGDTLFVSVGNWSTSTGVLLNAAANRSFGLAFNQTSGAVTISVNGGSSFSGSYTMTALQTVKIFINDNDTTTLDYLVPGTSTVATLNANSAVVYLNGALIGTETSSGFVMSTVTGSGNTTGNASLGRIGFNSTTSNLADFLIDNVYASSISAVPEPSAAAALAGVGILGFALAHRRRHA